MRKTSLIVLVLVGFVFGSLSVFAGEKPDPIPTGPAIPVLPVFESSGNVSFETGTGWWSMSQYDAGAQIYLGAYSTNRVIRTNSSILIDPARPADISFNVTMSMIDDQIPTGKLDFYQNSSSGESNSSMRVYDYLGKVQVGYDGDEPIYIDQFTTNLNYNLNIPASITSVNVNTGRWTESWGDEKGDIYFSRSGDNISFCGYGTLIGADPAAIANQLVTSGMASYCVVVPEPATIGLMAFSALGLLIRRR